jgi:hypothetical protein
MFEFLTCQPLEPVLTICAGVFEDSASEVKMLEKGESSFNTD